MSNLIIFFTLLFMAACCGLSSLVFGTWLIGLVVAAVLIFGISAFVFWAIASDPLRSVGRPPSHRRSQASRRLLMPHPSRIMLLILVFGVVGAGIGTAVGWEVGATTAIGLLCALILLVMGEDVGRHRRRLCPDKGKALER